MDFSQLKFDANGLIPAIAQDARTNQVLMLAYMNQQSIEQTLETGYATYFSRSRQALWKKGETSGHTQKLVAMRYDCDHDAMLLTVEQVGPACHTGAKSCFFNDVYVDEDAPATANVLQEDYATNCRPRREPRGRQLHELPAGQRRGENLQEGWRGSQRNDYRRNESEQRGSDLRGR